MITPDIYKTYVKWKDWDQTKFASFTKLDALYFLQELNCSGILLNNNLKILEIGFGNGTFAGWAKANSLDYMGIEINPELVQRACEHGISAVIASGDLREAIPQRTFDVIVAFDVIEHMDLNDIINLLEQIRCLLKQGGLFIARIPSGDSPFSGAIQYGDITHRTILGSSAVRQLAAIIGFDLIQVRSPVLPLRGVGILRAFRRMGVLLAQEIVGKFISVVFQDNRHTVITANMIFVFRLS